MAAVACFRNNIISATPKATFPTTSGFIPPTPCMKLTNLRQATNVSVYQNRYTFLLSRPIYTLFLSLFLPRFPLLRKMEQLFALLFYIVIYEASIAFISLPNQPNCQPGKGKTKDTFTRLWVKKWVEFHFRSTHLPFLSPFIPFPLERKVKNTLEMKTKKRIGKGGKQQHFNDN